MEFLEWEFAQDFTALEAAGLLMGFNPSHLNEIQLAQLRPILRRMDEAYCSACGSYSWDIDGFYSHAPDSEPAATQKRTELKSEAMREALLKALSDPEAFNHWYFNSKTDFPDQRFSRKEIARWLNENRFPSKYEFLPKDEASLQATGRTSNKIRSGSSGEKALTTTERNTLLLVIAALAEKAGIDTSHRKSASAISALVEMLGAVVTPETIRDKLDLIPAAVSKREVVVRVSKGGRS